jgi:hypothetical protein
MENKVTDTHGNEITIIYDETTDMVTVKNPAFDNDFHEVRRSQLSKPNMVVEIRGLSGEDSWDTWSDFDTRHLVVQTWLDNKKDKE